MPSASTLVTVLAAACVVEAALCLVTIAVREAAFLSGWPVEGD